MWSDNLIISSKRAYFLINNRNGHRKNGPDTFYSILIFLIQFVIAQTVFVFVLTVLFFSEKTPMGHSTREIDFLIFPASIAALLSYLITQTFFDPFQYVNKCVLQCYFIDEEMFVGTQTYVEPFIFELLEFYDNKKVIQKVKEAVVMEKFGVQNFVPEQSGLN